MRQHTRTLVYAITSIFSVALVGFFGYTFAANLNVGELDLDFCEGGNKFHATMDANTSTGICMRITNLSVKTGLVMMGFVDGEMSQGETSVQACKTDAAGIFGRSITLDEPHTFVIQGGESVIKTGNLDLATGFAGNMYGCITYTVLEDEEATTSGQMFSIVSRKANTLSFFVSGEVQSNLQLLAFSDTLGNNPLIRFVKNGDGTYTVGILLANKGTTNEKLVGTLHITNTFGFHRQLPLISDIELYPEEEKEFARQIGLLPWYGGQYTVRVELHNQAIVDSAAMGPQHERTEIATFSYGIGKYGWISVAGGGVALLLIVSILLLVFRKKKSKKKDTHSSHA